MKKVGVLFLVASTILMITKETQAASSLHQTAFCYGYASKMEQLYNTNYYTKMKQYFDNKIDNDILQTDNLISEYFQSGSEVVNKNLPLITNKNDKCEEEYKNRK